MGTRFAPSYANLYMGFFEETHVWHSDYRANLVHYVRYIDDLFIIWDGSYSQAEEFVSSLNSNSFNLKFSFELNPVTINFLDVTLSAREDTIVSKNFSKPTDAGNYLHFRSSHHRPWIEHIPRGQMTRLRRNCVDLDEFYKQAQVMARNFEAREYPSELLDEATNYAANLDRDLLLNPDKIPLGQDHINSLRENIPFITKFNNKSRQIRNIIKKNFIVLKQDELLVPLIGEHPQIVFKKNKNLGNILAPSRICVPQINTCQTPDLRLAGCYRCDKKRCLTCSFISHGSAHITSVGGDIRCPIKERIDCETSYVIYVLQCTCPLQYVGRTMRKLKERFREHRRNIEKGNLNLDIYRHFKKFHNQNCKDITIYGIEHIKETDRGGNRFNKLCQREAFWTFKLQTLYPDGLNEKIEFRDTGY